MTSVRTKSDHQYVETGLQVTSWTEFIRARGNMFSLI